MNKITSNGFDFYFNNGVPNRYEISKSYGSYNDQLVIAVQNLELIFNKSIEANNGKFSFKA